MLTRKNQFNTIMEAINGLSAEVASIRADVDSLKAKPAKIAKTTSRKSTAKKSETTKKSSTKKTATVKKPVKTVSMKLADFEPCKFKDSDNYVWGGTHGYKAMRSAYCYAKQTDGKAKNLADAKALGYEIDFDKAWAKAKTEFEKKYVYVKASDR